MDSQRKNALKSKLTQNSNQFEVCSAGQLVDAWQNITGKEIASLAASGLRTAANYASATLDSITAKKIINDLGADGRVILKNVGNKQYVIFKGYPGKRSLFRATRYLATNPKVVDLAIGEFGVGKSIISGTRLTFLLVVPLNVLNYLLNDQQTMTELVGKTATDIVKLGIASALSAVAASAVMATTTLAAGPLIAAIAVGVLTGLALDAIDEKFGITEALVEAMDEAIDSTVGEFSRQVQQVKKQLKWQAENGEPVGLGIFY